MNAALPEVFDAELDSEALSQLLGDIELCAEVIDVRIKGAEQCYAADETCSLARGIELLAAGSALGLQIRYRHKAQEWWDTVMRVGEAYRLIRMRAPDLS